MIILYEHHLRQIEQMCDEMPGKYMKQIIGFLAAVRNEQASAQAAAAKEAEATPADSDKAD